MSMEVPDVRARLIVLDSRGHVAATAELAAWPCFSLWKKSFLAACPHSLCPRRFVRHQGTRFFEALRSPWTLSGH
jgi:hypothetical protein